MKFFLRHLFPISYFQATRLNRWALVGYNGLVEWIPALALALFYNDFQVSVIQVVLLSYLGFICIYEIGYITNDFLSERFEAEPRGRSSNFPDETIWIWLLVIARIAIFLIITAFLEVLDSSLWWGFHLGLAVTFGMHNAFPSAWRVPTFFALSTFRYLAPIILVIDPNVLVVLLPAVLINNSLYRTTVYVKNKSTSPVHDGVGQKFAFYLASLPLSIVFAIQSRSILPLIVCVYYMVIWTCFWTVSRAFGWELGRE